MSIVVLLIASLAVWRVARMITLEEGPFSVFSWIRGRVDARQQTWIGRGLSCLACVSFWLAALVALILQASVLEWFAVAGGVMLIDRWSR